MTFALHNRRERDSLTQCEHVAAGRHVECAPIGRLSQCAANGARSTLAMITFLGEPQDITDPDAAVLVAGKRTNPMFSPPAAGLRPVGHALLILNRKVDYHVGTGRSGVVQFSEVRFRPPGSYFVLKPAFAVERTTIVAGLRVHTEMKAAGSIRSATKWTRSAGQDFPPCGQTQSATSG